MKKISVIIVEDHKMVREMWASMFADNNEIEVIGESGEFDDAIEMIKIKRPDIVLLDINLPQASGMDAVPLIRQFAPGSRIIAVSMHNQPAYAKKMLQMGARGYVTKNSSKEEMIKAILEVNHGNKYICDEIKNIISEQLLDEKEDSPNINALTEREMQIINFIKEGLSSKEIATSLNISLKTVEVHRHNILKKLKLKNSASLVNFINTNATYI